MQISHETPLALLKESRFFNDFDYALVHLLNNPEYFNFYKESLEMGRTVYLDNSLYELGTAFNPEEYVKWINELNPTYYIIPDTFWDTQKTINQAMHWFIHCAPLITGTSKPIGVCQGGCYEDIVRCYKFMDSVVGMIAFTFKFPKDFVEKSGTVFQQHWKTFGEDCTEWMFNIITNENEDAIRNAMLRYALLTKLDEDGYINHNKLHHLLGLQNTAFLEDMNRDFNWIHSIDTSNPIISGLCGCKYSYENTSENQTLIGNDNAPKPTRVLADFFDKPISANQYNCIKFNVMAFREYCGDPVSKMK